MSTETVTQKRKSRKTFDEIVQEIKTILSKTKAVYVVDMCEALREEHADWSNVQIRDKVEETCVDEFGWNEGSVYVYLPSWIHNQARVKAQKANWERRHKSEVDSAKKKIFSIASDTLQEPKIRTEAEEDNGPETILDEIPLIRPLGDDGESVLDLFKNINKPARELFKGLTNKEMPVGVIDDLILDYLKPSREFRNKIFYEVEERMLTGLYNNLTCVQEAIEDTLDLIDKIRKGAKR